MKKQVVSKSSNLFIMKHLRFISIIMFSCVWTITFGKAPIAKLIEVRIIPEHKDYLYKGTVQCSRIEVWRAIGYRSTI